ncbi:hypothetical protein GCM10027347_39170 [Larkinella harenae]
MSLLTIVQNALHPFGIHLNRYIERAVGGFSYQTVSPNATYAPWTTDQAFLNIYRQICSHTLVDVYRCYELWTLMAQVGKLPGPGDCLEVGVWRGGTAGLMASKMKEDGLAGQLYAADTFEGVVKANENDASYRGGEHANTSLERVEALLFRQLNCTNVRLLKGIFPDDTAHQIPADAVFRFCHIDVDVYQSAKDILGWVWERLLVGGIVVFDDYGFSTCDGITRLVEEWRNDPRCLLIHNLNGHAILFKVSS